MKNYIWEVFKKTSQNRYFELNTFENVRNKKINLPVYLSAGQETISASISEICKRKKIKPLIFPQHRCHSIYLSFGGNLEKLILELLGSKKGCTYGWEFQHQFIRKDKYVWTRWTHGNSGAHRNWSMLSVKKTNNCVYGDASAEKTMFLEL